jgi:hypothetical protein
MRIPLSVLSVLALVCFLVALSCKKKDRPPKCDGKSSTYNSNIKAILNSNCTASGCHPNYNSYAGLREVLNNGKFREKVLETKEMPKGRTLSSNDLIKIQCWVDASYPEN